MNIVALSGGKDSTALALLMPEAQLVFTDTGYEFPELYRQLDAIESATGREIHRIVPDENLPEYILRSKFLPGHAARFCTRMFKIESMNNYLATLNNPTLCVGLRADEPADQRIGNQTGGLSIRYPLREYGLGRNDVLRYCLEHDLLPRYPVYMARGGCMGCYYKRKSEVKAMAQLCPEILEYLCVIEETVQDERGRFAYMFPNTGMSISDMMRQPALFDMTTLYADALDTNDYGKACGLFCGR